MSPRLPVHCCCTPGLRLGSLPAPAALVSNMTFVLQAEPHQRWQHPGDPVEVQQVTLRVRTLQWGGGRRILAFDSGHQPIEVLRRLPGWRDA